MTITAATVRAWSWSQSRARSSRRTVQSRATTSRQEGDREREQGHKREEDPVHDVLSGDGSGLRDVLQCDWYECSGIRKRGSGSDDSRSRVRTATLPICATMPAVFSGSAGRRSTRSTQTRISTAKIRRGQRPMSSAIDGCSTRPRRRRARTPRPLRSQASPSARRHRREDPSSAAGRRARGREPRRRASSATPWRPSATSTSSASIQSTARSSVRSGSASRGKDRLA